ncbi:hypothetical protein [Gordonia westfalica]|uniref:Uncharacterized protein n=1 Tax=Gordonia westfalica TaxID=158898 RepID=A0A1H2E6D3_9ACTN|nr:hypothetical protein [Gordonia westfalica]SDT90677.1 hypothetical protein SAMN04488548_1298 [Gordonia westfalica]
MKRAIALAAAALFTTTLGAGVADAAPRDITPTIAFPGEHVRYFFSSDTPRNDIAYYAAGGRLVVAKDVVFQPTLINIGSGPRYHTHRAFTSPAVSSSVRRCRRVDGRRSVRCSWMAGLSTRRMCRVADSPTPTARRREARVVSRVARGRRG